MTTQVSFIVAGDKNSPLNRHLPVHWY